MLKKRGAVWWFKRKVRPPIWDAIGTREIALSLRTDSKSEAERRHMSVWLETERILEMAQNSIAREQALILLRALAREAPWEQDSLKPIYQRARKGEQRELAEILAHTKDDILALPKGEQAQVLLHLRELTGAIDSFQKRTLPKNDLAHVRLSRIALEQFELDETLAQQHREKEDAPEATIENFIQPFLAEKSRSGKDGDGYTPGTVNQARGAFRLWRELMGDIPLRKITGQDAGHFRDLLLRLPASHGKAVGKGQRTAPIPALRAIEIADAKDEDIPRLTMKTAKKHFSFLQQMFKFLLPRNEVTGNPFAGFSFPGTKAKRSSRDEWSPSDLVKVLTSPAMQKPRNFWLIGIAMFSGMRLEEICRLRPSKDIQEIEGTPCFLIQEHSDPAWSPKSEAGERCVPIHPTLIALGVMDLVEIRKSEKWIIPSTKHTGVDDKLGAEFSRQFSKLKIGLGVSDKTAFHSFRASVRTILGNQDARIRETWIDACLGHESAGGSSLGISVYLKKVGVQNLKKTIEAISYPDDVMEALTSLRNN